MKKNILTNLNKMNYFRDESNLLNSFEIASKVKNNFFKKRLKIGTPFEIILKR